MKAIAITKHEEPIQLLEKEVPAPSSGECLVKIKYAGLNRRDQWIREGKYPGIEFGCTLGSDAYGLVVEGSNEWIEKEVLVNPNIDWGNNPEAQSSQYQVLGMPTDGTLAEYICVPEDRLVDKPEHLTPSEAAALPLAGLTAYRAVFVKGEITDNSKVLVTGVGGGVATLALQFSLAAKAQVWVTSGEDSKIKKVVKLGAIGGFNYKESDWIQAASEKIKFDVIIDSAGGDHLNDYLKLAAPGGKIVVYGSTTGAPKQLDVFRLFWSQVQIIGSTMGNDVEFVEMVDFVTQKEIRPILDHVYPMHDYLQAFDRFKNRSSMGKIVLQIPT
ncbi:MAG: zinc-binding dehydrogenase [Bacteroidota bacterium]